jgi:hypothetical protein
VNFQQKISDDRNRIGEDSDVKGPEEEKGEEEHLSDEYDEPVDPEEDWYVVGSLQPSTDIAASVHSCEGAVYSLVLCHYIFCCLQPSALPLHFLLFTA